MLAPGFNTVQLHEPLDTVLADPRTLTKQLFPDTGPAVFAFAAGMGYFDAGQAASRRPGLCEALTAQPNRSPAPASRRIGLYPSRLRSPPPEIFEQPEFY